MCQHTECMRAIARRDMCAESIPLTSGIRVSTTTGALGPHDGSHQEMTLRPDLGVVWVCTKATNSVSNKDTLVMRVIAHMTNPLS